MTIPQKITLVIRLIWATFAVLVAGWLLTFIAPVPADIQQTAETFGMSTQHWVMWRLGGLAVWGVLIFIVTQQLRRGKEWARILCVIVLALHVLSSLSRLTSHAGDSNAVIATLSVIANSLHISMGSAAIFFLLSLRAKPPRASDTAAD